MQTTKFIIILITAFFILAGCSVIDKLKEKLSSKKDENDKKEQTVKEETKEVTSTADIDFYNKYIEVTNKIQESGDKVYKDYISDVPDPKSVNKGSFIIAVGFNLEWGS